MEINKQKLTPALTIHPGDVLREELKERGLTQKELARILKIQPTHLNEFIRGKRNLTEALAIKLEEVLGIPFNVWMNLHNSYVYAIKNNDASAQADECQAIHDEKICNTIINLPLLYKRLGMSRKKAVDRVKKLRDIFSFNLLDAQQLSEHLHALYMHGEKSQINDRNILTWLLINEYEVKRATKASGYKKENAQRAALEIAHMANNDSATVGNIKRCLYKYGITYIEVANVDKTPINAYTLICEGYPVITVTYRYNDGDRLVFDILSALYHIEHHLINNKEGVIMIDDAECASAAYERDANNFARNMLIPKEIWDSILKAGCKNLDPAAVVKTIAYEAAKRGISRSIAVARYKYDTSSYRTSSFRSPKIVH